MHGIRHVLLVEDNPYDVELKKAFWRKHNIGNELVVLRDGAEAIDYMLGLAAEPPAPAGPERPVLVILDFRLPKHDGIEVIHRVSSHPGLQGVPLLLMISSEAEKEYILSRFDGSLPFCLTKPLEIGPFVEALGRLGLRLKGDAILPAS